MLPFQTILVAADLSKSSREAFRVACSLACEDKTRVIVLNVMEPRYVPETPVYFGDQTLRYIRVARDPSEHESLEERLREVYAPDQPLDVVYQSKEGDAAEEVLRSSEEFACDLIVMGTHGRTGLRRLLAGSIAEAVLRKARCPLPAARCWHCAARTCRGRRGPSRSSSTPPTSRSVPSLHSRWPAPWRRITGLASSSSTSPRLSSSSRGRCR
jgi:universal stress protein A